MKATSISSDRVHAFNERTLAMDRELGAEFEVDLLLMPEELKQNSIVAAQLYTAGDKNVCPLCASQEGNVYPVDSPEWGRMTPPLHGNCRCILSYITSQERGVEARIKKYEPVDPDLLKKWSSKFYTEAEIAEMVKAEPKLPFDFIGSEDEKKIVEDLFKKLPSGVRDQVRIRTLEFSKYVQEELHTKAMYFGTSQRLEISRVYVDLSTVSGKKTIIHEMGHSLEHAWTPAERLQIQELFKGRFYHKTVSDYAMQNTSEFWAENFGHYFLRPDTVKQANPDIYKFIEKFVARLAK